MRITQPLFRLKIFLINLGKQIVGSNKLIKKSSNLTMKPTFFSPMIKLLPSNKKKSLSSKTTWPISKPPNKRPKLPNPPTLPKKTPKKITSAAVSSSDLVLISPILSLVFLSKQLHLALLENQSLLQLKEKQYMKILFLLLLIVQNQIYALIMLIRVYYQQMI